MQKQVGIDRKIPVALSELGSVKCQALVLLRDGEQEQRFYVSEVWLSPTAWTHSLTTVKYFSKSENRFH
ncbi:hypothetical protein RRG08_060077 [Elysia crispata]|uniref:Uncharacterized protein n=1 Tax=Elysia crispata TaxID=231223 RepID=A0AAE0Y067_9GAST|nr:hypothetical protein RRG08_060077 [Elysia crispata]